MKEFRVKSSISDVELRLTHTQGDYFTAEIMSDSIRAVREVWAYTDAYMMADLLEWIASQEKPWDGSKYWESIEGEFKFTAQCTNLGHVIFGIELNQYNATEQWSIDADIRSDFGSLPLLAKAARKFFGDSPN